MKCKVEDIVKEIKQLQVKYGIKSERKLEKHVTDLVSLGTKYQETNNIGVTVEPKKKEKATPIFDTLPEYTEDSKSMTYAGIGSRKTSEEYLEQMTKIAKKLDKLGYKLQTGLTWNGVKEGADGAFIDGSSQGNMELFTPESIAKDSTEWKIAEEIHGNFEALTSKGDGGAKLMARNTNQVFGKDLDNPVDFVLAWTPLNDKGEVVTKADQRFYGGKGHENNTGGTGQAIAMASKKGIPVINMADPKWEEQLEAILKKDESKPLRNKVETVETNDTFSKSNEGILIINDTDKQVEAHNSSKGIITTRVFDEKANGLNPSYHYGNPFMVNGYEKDKGDWYTKEGYIINAGTEDEVSLRYASWLKGETDQNVHPVRRKWIVDQIKSKALDNKKLIYFYESKNLTHAKVLRDLIKNKDLLETTETSNFVGKTVDINGLPITGTHDVISMEVVKDLGDGKYDVLFHKGDGKPKKGIITILEDGTIFRSDGVELGTIEVFKAQSPNDNSLYGNIPSKTKVILAKLPELDQQVLAMIENVELTTIESIVKYVNEFKDKYTGDTKPKKPEMPDELWFGDRDTSEDDYVFTDPSQGRQITGKIIRENDKQIVIEYYDPWYSEVKTKVFDKKTGLSESLIDPGNNYNSKMIRMNYMNGHRLDTQNDTEVIKANKQRMIENLEEFANKKHIKITQEIYDLLNSEEVTFKEIYDLILKVDKKEVNTSEQLLAEAKKLVKPKAPTKPSEPKTNEKGESKYEIFPGVYANEEQKIAIDTLGDFINDEKSTTILLKGRGGVGKTSVISRVLANSGIPSNRVHYYTHTNKAIKVLEKMARKNDSYSNSFYGTIAQGLSMILKNKKLVHKMVRGKKVEPLMSNGGFNVSPAQVVVVDEASMINSGDYNRLVKIAKDSGIKLIFMGDNVQLPPVNDVVNGQQLLESKVFANHPTGATRIELKTRMRQSEESSILPVTDEFAKAVESRIIDGIEVTDKSKHYTPKLTGNSDKDVIYTNNATEATKQFVDELKKDPTKARWVMFNNNENKAGIAKTNEVRHALFGEEAKNDYVEGEQLYVEVAFDEGKVYTVGDELTVQKIDKTSENVPVTYNDWSTGKPVAKYITVRASMATLTNNLDKSEVLGMYMWTKETSEDTKHLTASQRNDIGNMVLKTSPAYVLTSHKSQGSTIHTVYADIGNIFPKGQITIPKLQAAYTATSRASDKLIVIGTPSNFLSNATNTKLRNITIIDKFDRTLVENDPSTIFVFGENKEKTSSYNKLGDTGRFYPNTTQAVIRGLKNAFGIITVKNGDSKDKTRFLSDNDFDTYKIYVDNVIKKLNKNVDKGIQVVLPKNGIGTGASGLKENAPKSYNYLATQLNKFVGNPNYMPLVPTKEHKYNKLIEELLIIFDKNTNGSVKKQATAYVVELSDEVTEDKIKEIKEFIANNTVSNNKTINIYSSDKNGYDKLSNLNAGPVTIEQDGQKLTFATIEGAHQFQKAILFKDEDTANIILNLNNKPDAKGNKWNTAAKTGLTKSYTSGRAAIELGKKVKDFDDEKWQQVNEKILEDIMTTYYNQNKEAKDLLLSTGSANLTHKAKNIDLKKWTTKFPEILMKIRDNLSNNETIDLKNMSNYSKAVQKLWGNISKDKREDIEYKIDKKLLTTTEQVTKELKEVAINTKVTLNNVVIPYTMPKEFEKFIDSLSDKDKVIATEEYKKATTEAKNITYKDLIANIESKLSNYFKLEVKENAIDDATAEVFKANMEDLIQNKSEHNRSNTSNINTQVAQVYGPVEYKYSLGGGREAVHSKKEIPEWLKHFSRYAETSLGRPKDYYNQVLFNRFGKGQGIGAHTDAEGVYLDSEGNIGAVAILSIGETSKPHFIDGEDATAKDKSLIEMNTGLMFHTVAPAKENYRYSITLRHIPEVSMISVMEDIIADSTDKDTIATATQYKNNLLSGKAVTQSQINKMLKFTKNNKVNKKPSIPTKPNLTENVKLKDYINKVNFHESLVKILNDKINNNEITTYDEAIKYIDKTLASKKKVDDYANSGEPTVADVKEMNKLLASETITTYDEAYDFLKNRVDSRSSKPVETNNEFLNNTTKVEKRLIDLGFKKQSDNTKKVYIKKTGNMTYYIDSDGIIKISLEATNGTTQTVIFTKEGKLNTKESTIDLLKSNVLDKLTNKVGDTVYANHKAISDFFGGTRGLLDDKLDFEKGIDIFHKEPIKETAKEKETRLLNNGFTKNSAGNYVKTLDNGLVLTEFMSSGYRDMTLGTKSVTFNEKNEIDSWSVTSLQTDSSGRLVADKEFEVGNLLKEFGFLDNTNVPKIENNEPIETEVVEETEVAEKTNNEEKVKEVIETVKKEYGNLKPAVQSKVREVLKSVAEDPNRKQYTTLFNEILKNC